MISGKGNYKMGGYGSGRPSGHRHKTDEMQALDLADLKRLGFLKVGSWGRINWSNSGRVKAEVRYETTAHTLILKYRYRQLGDEWHDVHDVIHFEWTHQHIGGKRRWFSCPGCKRRCRILFGGVYFRCRKCHRLVYDSQYHRFPSGNTNQLQKVRHRLGGSTSLLAPFPHKPKGMHWKTYERLKWADMRSFEILETVMEYL